MGGHLVELSAASRPTPGLRRRAAARQPGLGRLAGCALLEVDLDDPAAAAAVVEQVRPDAIVHLAGQSSVQQSWLDPGGTLRTNVLGIVHLLDAARRAALRPAVLVVGSAEEYGLVRRGRAAAARGRAAAARLALRREQGGAGRPGAAVRPGGRHARSCCTRTFHHTGPGRGEAFAESSFARQIAEIEAGLRPPVIEVGNLEAVRDFTDVRDVVRAYWLLLENGRAGRGLQRVQRPRPRIRDLLDLLLARSSARGRGAGRPGAPAPRRRARAGRRSRAAARGHRLGAAHPARADARATCSRTGGRASRGGAAAPAMKVLLTGGDRLPGQARGPAPRRARPRAAPAGARDEQPRRPAGGRRDRARRRHRRRLARARGRGLRRRCCTWPRSSRSGCRTASASTPSTSAGSATRSPPRAPPARGSSTRRRSSRSAPRAPGRLDESRPHPGERFRNDYERTKAQADALAREAAAAGRRRGDPLPGRRLRPGRPDRGQPRRAHDRRPPERPPAGRSSGRGDRLWSYAFVEDVAEGHVARARARPRGRALRARRRERDARAAVRTLVRRRPARRRRGCTSRTRSRRLSAARCGCGPS